jgi:ubiquinone/menaquinone biosynthesis C-methylase UbiE
MADTEIADGTTAAKENGEAIRAWDGPLFDRFLRFKELLTGGLGIHGEAALSLFGPAPGERVLDIGCGFGDTTQRIAGLVGERGMAVGVDAAPRFIAASREDAAAAGVQNIRFLDADVQTLDLEDRFDMAFSRFGTMFFANPVVAMRNVRRLLLADGRLVMVVWRRREDNEWMYRAQRIVEQIVSRPEQYDEPTCGPGPFSMAGADTTSDILLAAGFEDIALRRCDLPLKMGATVDDAIELVTAIGPAGEILRLQGDRAKHLHGEVDAALKASLADLLTPEGVMAAGSTWIVTARSPGWPQ